MPQFLWEPAARDALRRIERRQAQMILVALGDYARSGQGNVSALSGKLSGRLRLRSGDYRVIFRRASEGVYQILKVGHRREIYRSE